MAIVPDDTVDPELQELVGSSSMTEVAKSLRPTPEFVIDADPLAELPFGPEDPREEVPFGKVKLNIVTRVASQCDEDQKAIPVTPHNTSLNSPHAPVMKMLIDMVRKNAALRKVRSSDGWDRLLESMTRYVEAQVASGGA